MHTVFIRNCSR